MFITSEKNYYYPMSLLSTKDTCAYLSTSRANLYHLLQAGKLEAIKMRRNTRIPYASIEAYIHSLPMTYGHRAWIDKHGNKQDQTKWHFKEPNSLLPLYGLNILAQRPTDSILIVEGEKTADAARILSPAYVVKTSQGGSYGASRNEWSVLKDKSIIIWPDHDQAWEDYAQDLSESLYEIGIQSIRKVALPTDLPNGWDLANSCSSGMFKAGSNGKQLYKPFIKQCSDD